MPDKRTILAVDDELGIRNLISYLFKLPAYETVTAVNPEEALKLLSHRSFDLMITDIRMPGTMDGIDLAEALWKQKPQQKVIFITGNVLEEKLQQVLQNPNCSCIRKPFDIRLLEAAVAQLLNA